LKTHDELLEKFDYQIAGSKAIGCECSACDNAIALRAVVELHKPQEITLPDGEWGANCVKCDGWEYPCETIQAIEKALLSSE